MVPNSVRMFAVCMNERIVGERGREIILYAAVQANLTHSEDDNSSEGNM